MYGVKFHTLFTLAMPYATLFPAITDFSAIFQHCINLPKSKKPPIHLFMIRLTANDFKGAVKLFQEEQAEELVRKGHW